MEGIFSEETIKDNNQKEAQILRTINIHKQLY